MTGSWRRNDRTVGKKSLRGCANEAGGSVFVQRCRAHAVPASRGAQTQAGEAAPKEVEEAKGLDDDADKGPLRPGRRRGGASALLFRTRRRRPASRPPRARTHLEEEDEEDAGEEGGRPSELVLAGKE